MRLGAFVLAADMPETDRLWATITAWSEAIEVHTRGVFHSEVERRCEDEDEQCACIRAAGADGEGEGDAENPVGPAICPQPEPKRRPYDLGPVGPVVAAMIWWK
jgi:hypothetical protein